MPGFGTSIEDWTHLLTYDKVTVTPPGGQPYVGTVDAKTDNSEVLWVLTPSGRRAYHFREGVRTTRLY